MTGKSSPYSGKYTYEVYVYTNRVGSRVAELFSVLDDYSEDGWDALDEDSQFQYLDDVASERKVNLYDWGWK